MLAVTAKANAASLLKARQDQLKDQDDFTKELAAAAGINDENDGGYGGDSVAVENGTEDKGLGKVKSEGDDDGDDDNDDDDDEYDDDELRLPLVFDSKVDDDGGDALCFRNLLKKVKRDKVVFKMWFAKRQRGFFLNLCRTKLS